MNEHLYYNQSFPDQHVVDAVVAAIEAAPQGILVSPDGQDVFILSNRPTEIYVRFECRGGVNFNDMNIDELRGYMRRKLAEGNIYDIEV